MHSEVIEIRTKRLNSPWPKFLRSLSINGFRGWKGQEVRFEFPICAIVGENGAGKSTILKAAASAYANEDNPGSAFSPSDFFFDTAWEKITKASITYKIVQGKDERTFSIGKPSERWRLPKKRPSRQVIWQDISRVLPLDATAGYAALAKRKITEATTKPLDAPFSTYYSAILGRQYSRVRIATSNLDAKKNVGVVEFGGTEYSQYHQGAGEDATLDLIQILQEVPNTSLVIIDEIEASLHPRAQRRLVHFLLWLTRTKQVQVILSTHSSYILEELPPEARVFVGRGIDGIQIHYGVSANYALSRIDDYDRPDLYLFTEDDEAVILTIEILRHQKTALKQLKTMAVGPADMVAAIGKLARDGKLPVNAIAVLDGDQPAVPGCLNLPGQHAPEKQIIGDIEKAAVNELAARLGLNANDVGNAIAAAVTLVNHHDWIPVTAAHLHQSRDYLWTTMCQVWVAHCCNPDLAAKFADAVKTKLKKS